LEGLQESFLPLEAQQNFVQIEEWMIFIQFFVCNFIDAIVTSLNEVLDILVVFLILYGEVYQKNGLLSNVFQYFGRSLKI